VGGSGGGGGDSVGKGEVIVRCRVALMKLSRLRE